MEEENDELVDMVSSMMSMDSDVMKQLVKMKKNCPSKFVSHWEMDENDVDEPTAEEIQNDPVLKALWAAENGYLDTVKEMVEADITLLQAKDTDGYSMLHRSAYNGHIQVVKYLLENGADVNIRTMDGLTPLHSAAIWQEDEVLAELLRYGADVNAQSVGGQTPLHMALTNPDNLPVIEQLLMHPLLKPELINSVGETAAQVARRNNMHYALFTTCEASINQRKADQQPDTESISSSTNTNNSDPGLD